MDPQEKERALNVLATVLDDPAQADKHDRIRAVLRKAGRIKDEAPVAAAAPGEAAPTPRMTVNVGLGPREYEDTDAPVPRVVRGLGRMVDKLNTPAMMLNKGLDTATLGLWEGTTNAISQLTGGRGGPSSEEYRKLEREHPAATVVSDIGGNLVPWGAPAKIGTGIARAADPLVSIAARRFVSAPAQVAGRALGGAIVGGGSAGTTAAAQTFAKTGSPEQAGRAALEAAPAGAALGGVLGGGIEAGERIAGTIRGRNPDVRALGRAGLEPSPIPGRPVVRQDQSLASQLPGISEPPLVAGRVTPETRGSAARVAADQIVPDITARKKASNQRFGQLQAELYATEGENPAPFGHLINDINQRLAQRNLPDATRKALGDVKAKFEEFIPKPPPPPPEAPEPTPEMVQLQTMLAGSKPGVAREGLQKLLAEAEARNAPPAPEPPEPPPPFTAKDLDQIRDYADGKVTSGEIKKGDVNFLQLSEKMRNTLAREDIAPGIAALNSKQHEIMKGFSKRKALLGMKRDQRGEGEDIYEAVARRVRERGEETATSGVRRGEAGHAVERAGRLGPPPVLPDTAGLPGEVSYQAALDVPRLQLAQENLQIRPSKVFSGGGQSPTGITTRLSSLFEPRVAYPLARRLSNVELAGQPAAAADLTHFFNRRRDKRKKGKGAELETRGATD